MWHPIAMNPSHKFLMVLVLLFIRTVYQIDGKTLANAVIQEVAIENVKVTFTGAVNGGRRWIGDVKTMFLETSKLKSRWWKPTYSSENSIRLTVRDIFLKES